MLHPKGFGSKWWLLSYDGEAIAYDLLEAQGRRSNYR